MHGARNLSARWVFPDSCSSVIACGPEVLTIRVEGNLPDLALVRHPCYLFPTACTPEPCGTIYACCSEVRSILVKRKVMDSLVVAHASQFPTSRRVPDLSD